MDYADIKRFSIVELRDGRRVFVTDVADQDAAGYAEDYIGPVETILVGHPVKDNEDENGLLYHPSWIVTDMSEVVTILS